MPRNLANVLVLAIKSLFRACGFEIRRRTTPSARKLPLEIRPTWDGALGQLVQRGFKPKTVIDVGAASGTLEIYRRFPESKHLLIEPLEEFSQQLQQIASEYDAHYIAAVATSKSGTVSLNVHPDLFGSSLLKECEETDVNGVAREVPAVTVDELCRALCLTGPYLIKVDVQGTELDVLAGAEKVLDQAEVVVLEVSLFRFFFTNPEIYEVLSYMKERHFVAYDIFGGRYRPLDNALAQVDIVFVKEHGQFRKEHFYATQEQRAAVTKRLRPGS